MDREVKRVVAEAKRLGYAVPSFDVLNKLAQFIRTLKLARVWQKLDVCYLFVFSGDRDFVTINLVNPESFKASVASLAFDETGFTCDGFDFIDTGYTPGAGLYQNDSAFVAWAVGTGAGDEVLALDGAVEVVKGSNVECKMHSVTALLPSTGLELKTLNRVGTTVSLHVGNVLIDENLGDVATSFPTANFLLGSNFVGTFQFFAAGSAMDAGQRMALYNAWLALQPF